jgi:CubicO group peptidase (beta-lactamase class C family)
MNILRRSSLLLLVLTGSLSAQAVYYPPPGSWESRKPEQVGLTQKAVDSAVKIAVAADPTSPKDLIANHLRTFGREPYGEAIGPFRDRSPAGGLIIKKGYIVAEWGDPDRVETTNSVTKSFVTTTVGLLFDRKLIRDIKDPVRTYMAPILALKGPPGNETTVAKVPPTDMSWTDSTAANGLKGRAYDAFEYLQPFESDHNRKITWEHLLRQSSDWQGTLWGKPDWADRFSLPQGSTDSGAVIKRKRDEPGTVFDYNDVRVNLMALSSLNMWRRPLPQVLKELVMDPIGASPTWRWFGYDNSWVVMDGQLVQSVSGGGHWGGGMIISARDMARFGYLTLRNGNWAGKQIISKQWIDMSRTPGPANKTYGFANYYLNTLNERGQRALPNAPESVFFHVGAGSNIIYVDQVNDLVIMTRWTSNRALDGMVKVLTGK